MKKLLPVAVLAAMTGVNSAQAVHVNSDGLGEVLLFPYYTAENGQDTYIQVVNTTNETKAVKVRFLESRNSVEVLDFNLYLSPQDHWSAVISADPNGDPNDLGAAIRTSDTSCTVPNSLSTGSVIPFRNSEYLDDGVIAIGASQPTPDPLVNGLARTMAGHVEVIEMGVIVNDTQNWPAFIKHGTTTGVPANCGALQAAWQPGGDFRANPSGEGIAPASGGLYGYGVIIDVAEGTDATYDAVALDNFWDGGSSHTNPGDLEPSLANGVPAFDIIDGSTVTSGFALDDGASGGVRAVSALFMHNRLYNDFVLEPSIAAGTDWVVTFPTKRDFVNEPFGPNSVAAPFSAPYDKETAQSCEFFEADIWNREELATSLTDDDLDFSPPRPGEFKAICYEANVLTFEGSNVLSSPIATNIDLPASGFDNGWMRLDFTQLVSGDRPALDGLVDTSTSNTFGLLGLPVIGFGVQKYVNGNVNGLLSNYVGNTNHKASRLSVSGAP